ncbi:SAM-dependent methyltransferase [Amycolatopsis rhabdoformis]|uniref:S-adenosyl-L-methionine-dependent methyltransferase n=1 Tax=Amycolatopsis rhabdoformis TaxID=1448059 RepID=A0ABZ1I864_9PSEU|nr:SAM-dependent methyltransferase [Amycolatopsis rhabdoformis]WSE30613.1 SAM-dependent methyltransferase [Amycolatopsis rhabdoformis]
MTVGSAFWIAAARARESEREDRLFHDPFAKELAGERGFTTMAASERATGGENAYLPVRVRWFDDVTLAAVADGTRQVVLLGAGLDTRPYRLDLPADVHWYEVDRAEVFTTKEPVLARATPRCHRRPVAADLGTDWTTPLLDAGFRPGERTLWIAEGLFFYLTEKQIRTLYETAAELSAPGSLFAADVTGTTGLDSPAMQPYRQWCAAHDVPPPFGCDDPPALAEAGGWTVEHLTAPGAADANHGRLRPQPGGLVPGRIHFVTAKS